MKKKIYIFLIIVAILVLYFIFVGQKEEFKVENIMIDREERI